MIAWYLYIAYGLQAKQPGDWARIQSYFFRSLSVQFFRTRIDLDKLRAIQTFVAVADGRGFAAAARKLDVSAATVTRLLSELETALGVTLVQRTTRQVTLTDTGKRYLQYVRAVLEDLSVADEATQGARGKP